MRISGLKTWLGSEPALAGASEAVIAAPAVAAPQAKRWSKNRVAAVEALWGPGFTGPGGAKETLRLASPMGLTPSLTMLLLGGGLGGPAAAIATKFGAWVNSFEADAEMAAIAEQRRQADPGLRRVAVAGWDRDAPAFSPKSVHHAMSLEALRGAPFAPMLAAVAGALRPHGHIVVTELVAGGDAPGADREFAAWCRLENRLPELPRSEAVSAELTRQGFDVRVVEDLSDQHVAATLSGWRTAVKAMASRPRPDAAAACIFVTEAELWLLRVRLMRRFGFRLIRWHAIAVA